MEGNEKIWEQKWELTHFVPRNEFLRRTNDENRPIVSSAENQCEYVSFDYIMS